MDNPKYPDMPLREFCFQAVEAASGFADGGTIEIDACVVADQDGKLVVVMPPDVSQWQGSRVKVSLKVW